MYYGTSEASCNQHLKGILATHQPQRFAVFVAHHFEKLIMISSHEQAANIYKLPVGHRPWRYLAKDR